MNASDALAQLASAARLDPERVFTAPWEARAFAIAVSLCDSGLFEWSEFRDRLIEEVAHGDAAQTAGSAEPADRYYEHFLRALERVLAGKGIVAPR
jgi:nitrile hydratase accessory protein